MRVGLQLRADDPTTIGDDATRAEAHDQIADHLRETATRWGIDYVVVRNAEQFAPVIERLR